MALRKNVNGVDMDMTAQEEADHKAYQAQKAEETQARKDAETAKQARIASAKSKLQNLGLTVEEVQDTFNI